MSPDMIIPTLILFAALVTDIRTRKIPNKLILFSIAIALISSYYFFEFEGLKQGSIAAGLAIIMTLPLVLIGALGAGDMKLMFAFGLASTYPAVFSVIVFSFFWAVFIGIGLALVSGRAQQLLQNILMIIMTRQADQSQLQRIPYTIPLFLGWITFIVIGLRQSGVI